MSESGESRQDPVRAAVEPDTARLRRVARRLVRDQENRRREVAAILHDELGQMLTALKLNLGALRAAGLADPERELLFESRALADELVERLRAVTLRAWPAMLDDLGLEDAVRWYADHAAGLAGCNARVEASGLPDDLEPSVRDGCFEAARACIDAAVADGGVEVLQIDLRLANGHVVVTVEHDGRKARENDALQLLRDRLESLNGELRRESLQGRGVRVRARVPLEAD